MKRLEDYDSARDGAYLRSLERAEKVARLSGLAIQNALASHPVTKYVKECPVEDLYGSRELHPATSESYNHDVRRFIEWGLPMRDDSISDRMGCGFRFNQPSRMRFTACSSDRSHYIKAARLHCWRLPCPNCGNDVAMKRGADVEKKILAYASLESRAGRKAPQIKHWVISPPQEWAIEVIRDADRYPLLIAWVQSILIEGGFLGGAMVFHPWRLQDDEWVLGPHFHVVGYGFVNNRRIHEQTGCIVKQVHPGERIRSVRQTIAYLLTHAGIGYAERDEDDIDFDMSILARFIPGFSSGEDIGYSEDDYLDMGTGRGRVNGSLEDVDWVEWTKRRYTQGFNSIRTFGVCSRRSIRVFDVYKEYRIRKCPDCGADLLIYNGFDDRAPEPSRYIHESPIMVFAQNFHLVKDVWQRFRSELADDGYTELDFAVNAAMTTCPQVMGLDDYDSEAAVSMRAELRDRVMRYVPLEHDMGLYPVVMTREQARIFDETGKVPEGVDHPDIRSGSPVDSVIDDMAEGHLQNIAQSTND